MLPFGQGGLDSLCGVYSIVNSERMVNNTTLEESSKLFEEIILYLDGQGILTKILTNGMLLKHVKSIILDVVGDRIPYSKLHFAGQPNPSLDNFWTTVKSFLEDEPKRAVLLGIEGLYSHWTVIKDISERRITLFDSNDMRHLNRSRCTTAEARMDRHHRLCPAQTYFLGRS